MQKLTIAAAAIASVHASNGDEVVVQTGLTVNNGGKHLRRAADYTDSHEKIQVVRERLRQETVNGLESAANDVKTKTEKTVTDLEHSVDDSVHNMTGYVTNNWFTKWFVDDKTREEIEKAEDAAIHHFVADGQTFFGSAGNSVVSNVKNVANDAALAGGNYMGNVLENQVQQNSTPEGATRIANGMILLETMMSGLAHNNLQAVAQTEAGVVDVAITNQTSKMAHPFQEEGKVMLDDLNNLISTKTSETIKTGEFNLGQFKDDFLNIFGKRSGEMSTLAKEFRDEATGMIQSKIDEINHIANDPKAQEKVVEQVKEAAEEVEKAVERLNKIDRLVASGAFKGELGTWTKIKVWFYDNTGGRLGISLEEAVKQAKEEAMAKIKEIGHKEEDNSWLAFFL